MPADEKLTRAVRATLQALPSCFERLVFVASLQNAEAQEQICRLLPLDQNSQKVGLAACREHHIVFEDWLRLSLEDKLADLEDYASGRGEAVAAIAHQWFPHNQRDQLVPRGVLPPEKRLFESDVEMLLTILVARV